MTLKSCLEIGTTCGLETVLEAIMNIDIHAINIFDYSKITEEINEIVKERDVLFSKTNFANDSRIIDVLEWLNSGQQNVGELTQEQPKTQEQTTKPEQLPKEADPDKDTFTIYQLKGDDTTRNLRFEPYDRLQAAGLAVDPANYANIYTAPLESGMSLEDIFERFNIDHPKDFKGHSLSVSDVVVLHQNGRDTAHYVDIFGFQQVPEFLQEQPKKE